MKKIVIFTAVGLALAAIAAVLILARSNSDDPRRQFARQTVDTLAANNWELSAIKPFFCDDRAQLGDKSGISFDRYQDYDGIKGVGKIRLIPVASPPAMAMDTFVPVLFNQTFAPFPSMPDRISYRATYLQLQTQKSADGKWCLEGWGRNDIPVASDQAEDFLNNKGIFNHD
jgi:hypothetical protein